jgi:hypothetical protein
LAIIGRRWREPPRLAKKEVDRHNRKTLRAHCGKPLRLTPGQIGA